MSGYLHFNLPGEPAIDAILKAVESASSSYHHTDGWNSDDWGDGSPSSHIEAAAGEAARTIATLTRERDEARADKWTLFEALGYPVPGDTSERLSSGELPVNGIAVALEADNERLKADAALGADLRKVIAENGAVMIEDNCELGVAVDDYRFEDDDGTVVSRTALATADTLDEALRAAASALGKEGE